MRAWRRTYDLPTIVTNCSNSYGPWQHAEKLILHTIAHTLTVKLIPLYGQGDQVRCWLYVHDHARALLLTKGRVGETCNIDSHNEKQNLQVVHIICDLLDEMVPLQLAVNGVATNSSPITQSEATATKLSMWSTGLAMTVVTPFMPAK